VVAIHAIVKIVKIVKIPIFLIELSQALVADGVGAIEGESCAADADHIELVPVLIVVGAATGFMTAAGEVFALAHFNSPVGKITEPVVEFLFSVGGPIDHLE
jgi:hypothetical protein